MVVKVEGRGCGGNGERRGVVVLMEGRGCSDSDGGEGVWW